MLKRKIKVTFRLNEKELAHLKKQAKRCGYSQERYLRTLIEGYVPRETPQMEYHQMIRERNAIGNRMNQISARANATGFFLAEEYKENYKRLMEKVLEIQAAVTLPDRW